MPPEAIQNQGGDAGNLGGSAFVGGNFQSAADDAANAGQCAAHTGAEVGHGNVPGVPGMDGQDGLQDGEAGQADGQQPGQQQVDPWAAPAPDWVNELGIKADNLGAVRDQVAELNSRAQLADAQQQLIADLVAARQEFGQDGQAGTQPQQATPQQATQQKAARPWIGEGGVFSTKEAYLAALHGDLNAVEAMRADWMQEQIAAKAGQATDAGQEALQKLKSMEERDNVQRWNNSLKAIEQRYEQFQDPNVSRAVNQFMASHQGVAQEILHKHPEVDIAGILARAGDYDRLHSEMKAMKGRMQETRDSAGVARTSVGAPAQPTAKPKTHTDAVRVAAERYRARTGRYPEGLENFIRAVESGTLLT